jgi:hypothetical protein
MKPYIDNLACVITYLDEERELPGDYVLKCGTDYEAFVVKVESGTIDSVSIGRYPTEAMASRAIYKWNALGSRGALNFWNFDGKSDRKKTAVIGI